MGEMRYHRLGNIAAPYGDFPAQGDIRRHFHTARRPNDLLGTRR